MHKYYIPYLLLVIGTLNAVDIVIAPYDKSRDFYAIEAILQDNRTLLMYEAAGGSCGTTQKYLDSSKYLTYVLRVDDRTVGFINYVAYDINFFTFHFGRCGLIHLLGVDKQQQGKGYGRQLLEYALADLTKLKVSRINVAVKKENLRAIGLYKKANFICPITPELAARLPNDMPLVMVFETGIPFDVSRGNIIQRYPWPFTAFGIVAIGACVYRRQTA
jgi:ribosomal protein S18 acetylase RimI-like enzyme